MRQTLLTPKEIAILEENNLVEAFNGAELQAYIYSKGYYDIEYFTDYFLSEYKKDKKTKKSIKTPNLHREIWESVGGKDSLIIVPRDHGKSTSLLFYLIWNICYEVDPEILLIMSEGLGASTIGKIRDEFEENVELRKIYGRLVPNKSNKEANKEWTKKRLQFLNGVKIATLTQKAKMRGLRPTLILVDDPQEDNEVENPAVTDKFNAWFFNTVYNLLDDSGRCIVVGTVIGPLCFVEYLKAEGRGFNCIEYVAIKDLVIKVLPKGKIFKINGKIQVGDGEKHIVGGKPLWPEKWSLEAMDRRYQKLKSKDGSDDSFMQEYMNEAMIINGKPFYNKAQLRAVTPLTKYNQDSVFEDLYIYGKPTLNCLIGVDVSEGVDGDYSTIRVRDRKTLKILAAYRGQIDPEDLPKVIDRLYKLGFTGRIGIEKNNHGGTTIRYCQNYDWYTDLYKTTRIDKITKKQEQAYGWLTSKASRPMMLDSHRDTFKTGELEIDKLLLEEMKYFFKNSKGRPEALPGHHDDIIMADAICLEMMPFPIYAGVKL